jgi:hypothetical protein
MDNSFSSQYASKYYFCKICNIGLDIRSNSTDMICENCYDIRKCVQETDVIFILHIKS